MYKFIIYSRKSRNAQDGHTQHTHETAEWEVNNYLKSLEATGQEYEIVDRVVENFSGYGYYTKRPLFSKVVERCKKDKSLTLLASKPDRIARDAWTGAELLKTINLVVASLPDADDLTLQLMFSVAEKEIKNMQGRWQSLYQAKKAKAEASGEKLIWGAASPKHQATFQANKDKHVKTFQKEASRKQLQPAVNAVKDMLCFSKGSMKLDDIAIHLNDKGLRTATGKEWKKANVSLLIKEYAIKQELGL